MNIVWKNGSGTVRDVVDILCTKRALAYTTVMTVMGRLVDKKLLCRTERADGSFLYKPCQSRDEFYATARRTIFGDLVRRFGAIAVAQFVDVVEEVDPTQIKALKQRLKRTP